ncbi:MAG: hypothetical protein ACFB02_03545 [Mastigocoleus sp.]
MTINEPNILDRNSHEININKINISDLSLRKSSIYNTELKLKQLDFLSFADRSNLSKKTNTTNLGKILNNLVHKIKSSVSSTGKEITIFIIQTLFTVFVGIYIQQIWSKINNNKIKVKKIKNCQTREFRDLFNLHQNLFDEEILDSYESLRNWINGYYQFGKIKSFIPLLYVATRNSKIIGYLYADFYSIKKILYISYIGIADEKSELESIDIFEKLINDLKKEKHSLNTILFDLEYPYEETDKKNLRRRLARNRLWSQVANDFKKEAYFIGFPFVQPNLTTEIPTTIDIENHVVLNIGCIPYNVNSFDSSKNLGETEELIINNQKFLFSDGYIEKKFVCYIFEFIYGNLFSDYYIFESQNFQNQYKAYCMRIYHKLCNSCPEQVSFFPLRQLNKSKIEELNMRKIARNALL